MKTTEPTATPVPAPSGAKEAESAAADHPFQTGDFLPNDYFARFLFGLEAEDEREALHVACMTRVESYFEHGMDAVYRILAAATEDRDEFINLEGFLIQREAAMVRFAYAMGKAKGMRDGCGLFTDPARSLLKAFE